MYMYGIKASVYCSLYYADPEEPELKCIPALNGSTFMIDCKTSGIIGLVQ